MKLLRLCAAVALLCAAVASPVYANTFEDRWQVAQVTPSPAAPVTQNTVSTTGPVSSETTISVGTVASQALQWVVAVFGAVLGTAGTALLLRMFKAAGLQISDVARARLQEMVVNGLNLGAKALENEMAGRGKIEIKNAVVQEAVNYVQDHGAETLRQLGVDPNSNMAVDAIKARIETAIADPMTPTPPVLDTVKGA
jgi:hypothetical protein